MGITKQEIKFGIFLVISIVTANLMSDPVENFLVNSFPSINKFFIGTALFFITAMLFNLKEINK